MNRIPPCREVLRAVVLGDIPDFRRDDHLLVRGLFVVGQRLARYRVYGRFDNALGRERRNVGGRHKLVGRLEALAVEILDHQQREEKFHIIKLSAAEDKVAELSGVAAVVGDDDDARVVINAFLFQVIQPCADPLICRDICLIVA